MLPLNIYNQLQRNGEAQYNQLKPRALELIANITGETFGETRTSDQDYILLPFAWMLEYFCHMEMSSPEYESRRQALYNEAMNILQMHKLTKPRTAGQAKVAVMKDIYE
jgi:hypothetical protein